MAAPLTRNERLDDDCGVDRVDSTECEWTECTPQEKHTKIMNNIDGPDEALMAFSQPVILSPSLTDLMVE